MLLGICMIAWWRWPTAWRAMSEEHCGHRLEAATQVRVVLDQLVRDLAQRIAGGRLVMSATAHGMVEGGNILAMVLAPLQ